ncbi:alpha/beta hydrolase [Dyella telluris]|uniref:Alpha/beta hydrolase n=1 Tax=Dyella telluris TaxID=2763498 RepID=A0A7G8Q026_9GAMM|nr:alpha/beta hydrolase [Dyella telluris]QNK00134.1 alpha/beta hydrolase [Dyella telluris]
MAIWRGVFAMVLALGCLTTARAADVRRDLAYGNSPGQRLDVYLPASPHASPIILMVHGGAWMFGDKASRGVVEPKATHWTQAGYVFVSVDYRLWPKAGPLQQAGDVADALAYVQKHAGEWGADSSRVVLMGHSAGAHLVALLSSSPPLATAHGATRWLGTVSLDSGAIDVAGIMGGPHAGFYDRVFGEDPARWSEASPIDRLGRDALPILLVCSSQRKESCPHNQAYAAKARQLGVQVSVLPEPLTHGDINATLGEPGGYTAAVDAFLHTLGLP